MVWVCHTFMAALCNRADKIIFLPCDFYLSFFFLSFFFSALHIHERRFQDDSCYTVSLHGSGFCSAVDRDRLDAFIRRCKGLHYSNDDIPTVAEMFENAGSALFSRVIRNDTTCYSTICQIAVKCSITWDRGSIASNLFQRQLNLITVIIHV